MAFQEIELNMIPHGDMPSFYASQYETGRPIIINVKMGEDDFACTDLFIELHARKVDDNIVTLEPDSVDGNQVVFVGTDQLFACPGKNLAELCLYADDEKDTSLGSLNFFIEVEPDPMAGGLTSETQIYDLYEQVEEITQQVIGDDYYNKTEVDDLLDDKADKTTTYTKSEVDAALNLKADKATTYTKTQTDNLLNDKADKATTYTKTQVDNALALKANSSDLATVATTGDYDDLTNKPTIPAAQVQSDYAQADNTQVDYIKNKPDLSVFVTSDALSEIIYDILPTGTASGAIANFDTDLSLPLVDCKANIVATGGNGTADNPNPINGYTEANITRCGVNLWDEETDLGILESDGSISPSSNRLITKNYIPIIGGLTYSMHIPYANRGRGAFYDENKNLISYFGDFPQTGTEAVFPNNGSLYPTDNGYYFAFIPPINARYMKYNIVAAYGTTYNYDISINCPSSDHDYHSYTGNTYTIAFGQSVYGGVLDLTRGKLHVTWGSVDLGSLVWAYNNTLGHERFFANVSNIKNVASNVVGNILCPIYQAVSGDNLYSHISDNVISVHNTLPQIWVYNSAYTDENIFKTAMNGILCTYELATPFDIDLTPTQINALIGVNNVYNDTNGDTEVKYKDGIQHYIDTRI